METKRGKKGVVNHHDMKDSAVFLHDKETGKKYHVVWSSVAKIDGKEVGGGHPEAKVATGSQVSQDCKDYKGGDTVVSNDGGKWTVGHAVGVGMYGVSKDGLDKTPTLLKWKEIYVLGGSLTKGFALALCARPNSGLGADGVRSAWGDVPAPEERARRRAARPGRSRVGPCEARDNLPLLATLVEQRAGSQASGTSTATSSLR